MDDKPKIPAAFQTVEVPVNPKRKLLSEEKLADAAQIVELLSAMAVQAKVSSRILALGAYNFYRISKLMVIDQDADIQATFYEDSDRLMDLMLQAAPQDVKDKIAEREKTAIRPS